MQVIGFSLVSEAHNGSFHLTNKVNASYTVLKGPWCSLKSFLHPSQSCEHLVQCSKGLRLWFMQWSQSGLPPGRQCGIEDRNMSFRGDWTWTGIPALPPTSCVTLGKLCEFSKLYLFIWKHALFKASKERTDTFQLAQCPAHSIWYRELFYLPWEILCSLFELCLGGYPAIQGLLCLLDLHTPSMSHSGLPLA